MNVCPRCSPGPMGLGIPYTSRLCVMHAQEKDTSRLSTQLPYTEFYPDVDFNPEEVFPLDHSKRITLNLVNEKQLRDKIAQELEYECKCFNETIVLSEDFISKYEGINRQIACACGAYRRAEAIRNPK